MYLAKNLKYLRKKRGLTQQRVVDILGLKALSVYQHYEAKRAVPPIAVLFKFSEFYGVDVYNLVNIDLTAYTFQNIKTPAQDLYIKYKMQPANVKKAIDSLLGM